MQDLDRSRGWSTISWLNRLINGSRGGSRPICITLAPPSSLEPVQRHRINPLRLFLRGTIYLSYGERCSLSAWEWSLSLVAWFNNNSWNDLFHLAIISSRRDNRSSRFNYFSMFKSRNCIFKLLHIASMYSVSIYQIISKVESLFKNFVHSSLRIIRKIYFCSSKTYIYIYISIIDIVIYIYVNFRNISRILKKKIFQTNILNHFQNNLEISPHG